MHGRSQVGFPVGGVHHALRLHPAGLHSIRWKPLLIPRVLPNSSDMVRHTHTHTHTSQMFTSPSIYGTTMLHSYILVRRCSLRLPKAHRSLCVCVHVCVGMGSVSVVSIPWPPLQLQRERASNLSYARIGADRSCWCSLTRCGTTDSRLHARRVTVYDCLRVAHECKQPTTLAYLDLDNACRAPRAHPLHTALASMHTLRQVLPSLPMHAGLSASLQPKEMSVCVCVCTVYVCHALQGMGNFINRPPT